MTRRQGTYVPHDALRLPQVADLLRTQLLPGVLTTPGAAVNVVKAWHRLGKLCPPDGVTLGIPWWRPATVRSWVKSGGHRDRRYKTQGGAHGPEEG